MSGDANRTPFQAANYLWPVFGTNWQSFDSSRSKKVSCFGGEPCQTVLDDDVSAIIPLAAAGTPDPVRCDLLADSEVMARWPAIEATARLSACVRDPTLVRTGDRARPH